MSRKHRAVTPESLDNRERDMDLEDRDPDPRQPPEKTLEQLSAPKEPLGDEPEEEDPEIDLRSRLKALREALPPAPQGSCRACFQRGARATLDVIKDQGSLRGQIAAVRKNEPPDMMPHSAADFKRGVAAIVEGIMR